MLRTSWYGNCLFFYDEKIKSSVMTVRQIEFKEETIQTLREVKRIMASEWLKHRMEVDKIIRRVRSDSFYVSKTSIDVY